MLRYRFSKGVHYLLLNYDIHSIHVSIYIYIIVYILCIYMNIFKA